MEETAPVLEVRNRYASTRAAWAHPGEGRRPGSGGAGPSGLGVSLMIATVAVTPALVPCPFFTTAHRCLAVQLLAGLRQWTGTLVTA